MKKKILQIFKKFVNSNLSFVSNKKIENCYMTDLLQYMIEKKEKMLWRMITLVLDTRVIMSVNL